MNRRQGVEKALIFLVAWALAGLGFCANLSAQEPLPTLPPPEAVSFPLPVVHQLDNGLRIVLVERHNLPILTLYAIVGAGAEADPSDLPGTAQLVAELLPEGAGGRSAAQIAQAIDQTGGTIDTGAGWDESYANVSVLGDYKERAFELLADILIRPTFATAEIERARKQTLSALKVATRDPSYLADVVLRRFLFAGSPYAHSEDGTLEAVRRITRDDLVRFHAQNYLPARTILAVVGDISQQDSLDLATRFLGGWKNPPGIQRLPGFTLSAPQTRRVIVIDRPDAVQTEIRIANLAIRRSSPDFHALTVANQVLGGPAANRLFEDLRTQRGLVYGASSELNCYSSVGAWVAKTSTRSSETVRATEMVLNEIKRLHNHPISEHELATAQSYLIGHEALEFESPSQIANQDLELMRYHLPLNYWNQFAQEIRSLTAGDILAATRKYLTPDNDVIVLVGKVAAFKSDLKKLGSVRVIPIADADNLAFPEPQKGSAASSAPAK